MTYYDAWLTALDAVPDLLDPGDQPAGAGPPGHCPLPEGHAVFFALRDGIRSGRFGGRQTGPLTWAAVMTPGQIRGFLEEVFGVPGDYERRHHAFPHLVAQMMQLRRFVAELPDGRPYAVVADEF